MLFTAIDPVPPSLWASYHVFGLLSWGHGLCTAILTLTAAACVRTGQSCDAILTSVMLQTDSRTVTLQVESTPELYYLSLSLTLASACSTGETPFPAERHRTWLQFKQLTPAGACPSFFRSARRTLAD